MASLADVNVLFALLYAGHSHAPQAVAWLEREGDAARILFCRVVQMGVLRLLTNRQVMQDEVLTPQEAWAYWDSLAADQRFSLVDEPPKLETIWREMAIDMPRDRCVETDTYLAAFALAGGHRLITFDRGFRRFDALDSLILEPLV